ncbi:hypothetical protein F3I16_01355 [Pseudomonas sp. L-22-4S-12]|uniref:hypothetical protein n=1 Tax=Pseudomonas sp. L-22-4S-12 TaxID=2610893 RepID=UPI001325B5F3|nr:hypothetical protein [Pseudomonas sp. L-22-4S-12]MWV14677.1 hypothetical protein [Pseudomonas sp. L-22-4S-12]
MRRLRLLFLPLCLLLTACDRDELVLHFDTPISTLTGGIEPALRESLEQALQEQHFDAEQFDLELLENEQSLRVSFAEPLDAARRQAVQGYFAGRLEARKQWSGKLTLEIQPERLDEHLAQTTGGLLAKEQREQLRKRAEAMRRQFESQLTFHGEAELVYSAREQDFPLATSSDETFCQLSAILDKPLPEISYRLQAGGNDVLLNDFFQMVGRIAPISIPHRMQFADANLQAIMDAAAVSYVLRPIPWAKEGDKRLRMMTFQFGSVGMVTHMDGMVTGSLERYERECLQRIIDAGRPFTYFYGKTLDRMHTVDYFFQEAS